MFVRYWMTAQPITISPQSAVIDAVDLMVSRKVNHLPVVENEQMLGMVSIHHLRRFIAPGQELKAAISQTLVRAISDTTVADVMASNVVTCSPETLLEDMGELMRKHRVSALPVLHNGALVGIISESDYLRAMASLAHLEEGRRICFRTAIAGKMESFYELVDLCRKHGVELLSLTTQPIEEGTHHLVLIRVRGARVDELVQTLWSSHHNVLLAE